MNCDLVFEILTRGPFPSGEPTDASVELHLARCHECRRLAEALRPAVELFHEALPPDGEADSLPGYYGALCEAGDPLSTAVAAPPPWDEAASSPASEATLPFHASPPSPRSRRAWGDSLRYAGRLLGGMAFGAAVCFALALARKPASDENLAQQSAAPAPEPSATAPPTRDVETVLASLQLPLACLTPGEAARDEEGRLPNASGDHDASHSARPRAASRSRDPVLADASHSAGHLLCCTHCHNAAKPRAPRTSAIALLQREACVACHHLE